jgi:hypothetical protein
MKAGPPTLRGWLPASLARDRPAVHGRFDGANTPRRSPAPPPTACPCGKHSWNRCTNFTPLINRCCADHRKLPGPTADRRRLDPRVRKGAQPVILPACPTHLAAVRDRVRPSGGARCRPLGSDGRTVPDPRYPAFTARMRARGRAVGYWVTQDNPVATERIAGTLRMTRVVARTRRQRERPHRHHRVGRRLPRVRGGRRLHGGQARCARRHTHAPRELWGQPVRVIEISPGLVETELSRVRFGVDEQRAAAVYERATLLSAAEHTGLRDMGSDAPAACQRRRGRRDGTSAGSGFSDSRSTASSRRLNGW